MKRTTWQTIGSVVASCSVALLLGACGGGGGSPPPAPYVPTCTGVAQIVADTSVPAGKTAGALVQGCSAALADVSWTQVSGPTVSLLANRSQGLSFESATAGAVVLRADVRDTTGATASPTVSISITAAPSTSAITARGDQSVRMGGNVSVRAWPLLQGADTVSTVTWSQLSGPAVTRDTNDPMRMLFTAPSVSSDTVLKFRVTMTTSLGVTDTDDVQVLVENSPLPASDALFAGLHVSRVHAYKATSPYAAVLASCTYDAKLAWHGANNNTLCKASTLPLLEQEASGGVPTVAQVMDRVVVSHDYMGANFEQFLLNQDTNGDFRRLLASTTAIVIGAHVRPSFYYVVTGAIYLDAANLWLTPEQRDVIDEFADYRLAFDKDLAFTGLWRYVLANQYANPGIPANMRVTRSMGTLTYGLGDLMYHELGHASDFFPPGTRNLTASASIYDNATGRIGAGALPSDLLAVQYPLTSSAMKGLAQVKFFGATADATQRSYTPTQVGDFFRVDVATDEYNYSASPAGSHSREDLAMLFEEFMMSWRYGVQRDVGFTNKFVNGMTGSDLFVAWGERGRIADPTVKPRIKLVLQQIAPWVDPATVDTLPAPVLMPVGASWTANLVLPGAPVSPASSGWMARAAVSATQIPRLQLRSVDDPALVEPARWRRYDPTQLPRMP
jgi:hypothetical protein